MQKKIDKIKSILGDLGSARKKTFFFIDVFPKYGVSREQQAEC